MLQDHSAEEKKLLLELAQDSPLFSDMARPLFRSLLEEKLEASFDIDEHPFACDSSSRIAKESIRIMGHSLGEVESFFKFPDSFQSIVPYISLRNYVPSAFSIDVYKHAFVGFSIGLYYAINDACSAIAHHHQYCEDLLELDPSMTHCNCSKCGGPRDLSTVYRDYSWLTGSTADQVGHWSLIKGSTQATPRSVVGEQLMNLCLSWASYHEAGHVVLGHHDWTQSDVNPYWEIAKPSGSNIPGIDPLRHFAEVEADRFATQFALANVDGVAKSLEERMERARKNTPYSGRWPNDLRHLAELVVITVPYILQSLFAVISRRGFYQWTPTHPSANLRASFAKWHLQKKMQFVTPDKGYDDQRLWQTILGAIHVALYSENTSGGPVGMVDQQAYHDKADVESQSFIENHPSILEKYGTSDERAPRVSKR